MSDISHVPRFGPYAAYLYATPSCRVYGGRMEQALTAAVARDSGALVVHI